MLALESTPYDLFGAPGAGSHLMPASLDWETSPARQLVDAAGSLPSQELRATSP